jgi:cephalosporin hydroxylase
MGKHFRKKYPVFYKYYQEILGEIYYEILCLGFIFRQYCQRKLHKYEKIYKNPVETLFNFDSPIGLYSLRTFQTKSEISELFNMVDDLKPRVIGEIGADMGATLYLWSKILPPNGRLVSIDLPRLYRKSVNRFIKSFFPRQRINFIREDSHSTRCLQQVGGILQGEKIDFLFIDGDHSYEGVKNDFAMYAPFVKPGGLIAFHDIAIDDQSQDYCGVIRFWNEIKLLYEHGEIIAAGGCGIGYLKWAPILGRKY